MKKNDIDYKNFLETETELKDNWSENLRNYGVPEDIIKNEVAKEWKHNQIDFMDTYDGNAKDYEPSYADLGEWEAWAKSVIEDFSSDQQYEETDSNNDM